MRRSWNYDLNMDPMIAFGGEPPMCKCSIKFFQVGYFQ